MNRNICILQKKEGVIYKYYVKHLFADFKPMPIYLHHKKNNL